MGRRLTRCAEAQISLAPNLHRLGIERSAIIYSTYTFTSETERPEEEALHFFQYSL